MNKRYLIIALFFFIIAILCLVTLLTTDFQSYALTGTIVSLIIGIGFLHRARERHLNK